MNEDIDEIDEIDDIDDNRVAKLKLAIFAIRKQLGYVSNDVTNMLFENIFGKEYLLAKMKEQTTSFIQITIVNAFTQEIISVHKIPFRSTIADLKNILFEKYKNTIKDRKLNLMDNDAKLFRNDYKMTKNQQIRMIQNVFVSNKFTVPNNFHIKGDNLHMKIVGTVDWCLHAYTHDYDKLRSWSCLGYYTVSNVRLPRIAYISKDLSFGYGTIHTLSVESKKKQLLVVKLLFKDNNIQIKLLAAHETTSITALTISKDETRILYTISDARKRHDICEIDTAANKKYIDSIKKINYRIDYLFYNGDDIGILIRSEMYIFKRKKNNKLCFVRKYSQRIKGIYSSIEQVKVSNYNGKTQFVTFLQSGFSEVTSGIGIFNDKLISIKNRIDMTGKCDKCIIKLSPDEQYVYIASNPRYTLAQMDIYNINSFKKIKEVLCGQYSKLGILLDFFVLPNNKVLTILFVKTDEMFQFKLYDIINDSEIVINLDLPPCDLTNTYDSESYCCNPKFQNLGLFFYSYETNTLTIHDVDHHDIKMINLDNYTML